MSLSDCPVFFTSVFAGGARDGVGQPLTHRAYTSAIDRVIALLGRDRPLAEIADAEIGRALAEQWRSSAPPSPHG